MGGPSEKRCDRIDVVSTSNRSSSDFLRNDFDSTNKPCSLAAQPSPAQCSAVQCGAPSNSAPLMLAEPLLKIEPMDPDEFEFWFGVPDDPDQQPEPHLQDLDDESLAACRLRPCYVRLESIKPVVEVDPKPEARPAAPKARSSRSRSRSRPRSTSRPRARSVSRPASRSKSVGRRGDGGSAWPAGAGAGSQAVTPRICLKPKSPAVNGSGAPLLKCVLCLMPFHLHSSLVKHAREHQQNSPNKYASSPH